MSLPVRIAASVALVLAAAAPLALAQDRDAVAFGRTIAQRHCGECHAIDTGAKSPHPDAPPLPQLHRRFPVERMDEALELGMMDDHPRMPNFELDADERQALTAYLASFGDRPVTPRRPAAPRRPQRLQDGRIALLD